MNKHNVDQFYEKQVNQAKIVELCREKAYCVKELALLCNLSVSAIARHLRNMGEYLSKSKPPAHNGRVYYSTINPEPFAIIPFTGTLSTKKKVIEPEFVAWPGGRIIRFDDKDLPDHYPERFEYTIKKRYCGVSGESMNGLAEALG